MTYLFPCIIVCKTLIANASPLDNGYAQQQKAANNHVQQLSDDKLRGMFYEQVCNPKTIYEANEAEQYHIDNAVSQRFLHDDFAREKIQDYAKIISGQERTLESKLLVLMAVGMYSEYRKFPTPACAADLESLSNHMLGPLSNASKHSDIFKKFAPLLPREIANLSFEDLKRGTETKRDVMIKELQKAFKDDGQVSAQEFITAGRIANEKSFNVSPELLPESKKLAASLLKDLGIKNPDHVLIQAVAEDLSARASMVQQMQVMEREEKRTQGKDIVSPNDTPTGMN